MLVAFAATAGCIVHAPPSSAPRADNEVRSAVRTFELASGLRVVLEQAPDFGGAGAVLVVGTGSAHDPPGKQGLAHFTEHLAFRSIHDGVSLVDGLDALMDVNAATYWDKTAFHAYGNAGSLQWMLRALCGILAAPVAGIDEAIFERERLVVENEVRLRNVE